MNAVNGIVWGILVFLAPILGYWLIQSGWRLIARAKAHRMLKLSPEDLPGAAMKWRKLLSPLQFVVPSGAIVVVAGYFIYRTWTAPDSGSSEGAIIGGIFGMILSIVGLVIAAFLILNLFDKGHKKVLLGLSEVIVEKGSILQAEAWMNTIEEFDNSRVSKWDHRLNVALEWGSLSSVTAIKETIGLWEDEDPITIGHEPTIKVQQYQELVGQLKKIRNWDTSTLLNMGNKYHYWNRLLVSMNQDPETFFEEQEGVLPGHLLKKLRNQSRSLQSLPDLFCPRCGSRGKALTGSGFLLVECQCSDLEKMETRIQEVVGILDQENHDQRDGSTYFLNLWTEGKNSIRPAEVDVLYVRNVSDQEANKLVAQAVLTLHEHYPGVLKKVELARKQPLDDNTLRIMESKGIAWSINPRNNLQ